MFQDGGERDLVVQVELHPGHAFRKCVSIRVVGEVESQIMTVLVLDSELVSVQTFDAGLVVEEDLDLVLRQNLDDAFRIAFDVLSNLGEIRSDRNELLVGAPVPFETGQNSASLDELGIRHSVEVDLEVVERSVLPSPFDFPKTTSGLLLFDEMQ